MTDISRRQFIIGLGAFSCCSMVGWSKLALAALPTDQRLLVILQRGAMDGLAAIAPFGDKFYHDARGGLALPDSALFNLDGFFALHKSLGKFHELYNQKRLLAVHAIATPYRSRSHFDAQDLLENGSEKPHGLNTGWLGRTVEAIGSNTQGLAMGPVIPLLLNGSKHVQSWAPSILPEADADFLARVGHMYQNDPALSNALQQAMGMTGAGAEGNVKNGAGQQFIEMMRSAASFMKAPDGARLATIDIGGWDTHANQGLENGRLANNFSLLGEGIDAYQKESGDIWNKTAILVITEFGRTVKANGTGGSDHGTGSTAFLMGGSVNGGRMLGDWPGLAPQKLYEGRDLYPANDLRSLLKGVLEQHMGLPSHIIEQKIFPSSQGVPSFKQLFI